jgi:hypothetical protein
MSDDDHRRARRVVPPRPRPCAARDSSGQARDAVCDGPPGEVRVAEDEAATRRRRQPVRRHSNDDDSFTGRRLDHGGLLEILGQPPRECDLEIGVRSGGHNIAGLAVPHGGLMIDLSGRAASLAVATAANAGESEQISDAIEQRRGGRQARELGGGKVRCHNISETVANELFSRCEQEPPGVVDLDARPATVAGYRW